MSIPVISKNLVLSSLTINDKKDSTEKQGIVSILGSETNEKGLKATSLRRTLSADMSSKKWLAQNGMKKIASSQHIAMTTIDSSSSSDDDEEEEENCMVNPRQSDIWSKIMSQKAIDNTPPYVHSLVRRSTSSLSEKSLKICTESLGSETGSDIFSSCPPSEASDADEEMNLDYELGCKGEFEVVKYNYATTNKKPTTRTFPPPLPSLARGGDGPSLHMNSHRQNGRLVLEAVTTTPSQNIFQAQRQNGRLLLTLANSLGDDEHNKFEQVFNISDKEEETEEGGTEEEVQEEEDEEMFETNYLCRSAPKLESEVINVHRSVINLKEQTKMANKNTTWPNNVVVDYQDWEEHITKSLQSSSPPVALLAATSFNSYEYFWRAKPTVASVINIPIACSSRQTLLPLKNNTNKAYMQKDLVLLRGNKADCLVPLLRGCKKPRRSLLFWEPHCIATS